MADNSETDISRALDLAKKLGTILAELRIDGACLLGAAILSEVLEGHSISHTLCDGFLIMNSEFATRHAWLCVGGTVVDAGTIGGLILHPQLGGFKLEYSQHLPAGCERVDKDTEAERETLALLEAGILALRGSKPNYWRLVGDERANMQRRLILKKMAK